MHANRPQIVKRAMGLALVAMLAAGCASTPSADASIFDEVRDLDQDLSRAVSATRDAVSGNAEPAIAARAIDRVSSASQQLASTAGEVRTPDLRAAADVLVSLTDRIVTQLTRADVDRAEALRASSFVPLASQFAEMKSGLPASALTTDPSGDSGLAITFVVVALAVAGVIVFLDRRRRRTVHRSGKAGRRPSERHESTRGEPVVPVSRAQVEPLPSDAAEPARATRIRPTDIDLRSLLSSTVDHALEREWQVSLVCPADVQISGDPVRIQRAILATLGNAFLEGAELAGIVVEVAGGQVLLSIGHDAPIDDPTAEDIAVRLANQMATALDRREVGWSVAAEEDIYLTTVSAGSDRLTKAGAGIPA